LGVFNLTITSYQKTENFFSVFTVDWKRPNKAYNEFAVVMDPELSHGGGLELLFSLKTHHFSLNFFFFFGSEWGRALHPSLAWSCQGSATSEFSVNLENPFCVKI